VQASGLVVVEGFFINLGIFMILVVALNLPTVLPVYSHWDMLA
jgi:hypothetical protein